MNMGNKLDRTAIHEAGHALVISDLGFKVIEVTIFLDEKGSSGLTKFNEPNIDYFDKSKENLKLIRKLVMIRRSGDIALERTIGGHKGDGAGPDWIDALGVVQNFYDNHEDDKVLKLFSDCGNGVKEIFNLRWPSVEAIANELLEKMTLNEQEVLQILEKLNPKPKF